MKTTTFIIILNIVLSQNIALGQNMISEESNCFYGKRFHNKKFEIVLKIYEGEFVYIETHFGLGVKWFTIRKGFFLEENNKVKLTVKYLASTSDFIHMYEEDVYKEGDPIKGFLDMYGRIEKRDVILTYPNKEILKTCRCKNKVFDVIDKFDSSYRL